MISINSNENGLLVSGKSYSSVTELLQSHNIDPIHALNMIDKGLSLNEILDRKKSKKTFKTGFDALSTGLLNLNPSSSPVIHHTNDIASMTVKVKFSDLKRKYSYISTELNSLHKICDEYAVSELKTPTCVVFNTLKKLHEEIISACNGRWMRLLNGKTPCTCNIEDIISGGVFDAVSIDLKKLEELRNSNFLIIKMNSQNMSENTKTSLGIMLRQRANQSKLTLLLTTSEFYFSLLDYPTFLKESFFEYGRYLHIIDANPSMSL